MFDHSSLWNAAVLPQKQKIHYFKALQFAQYYTCLIHISLKFTDLETRGNSVDTVANGIGTDRRMSKAEAGSTSPRIGLIQIKKARLTPKKTHQNICSQSPRALSFCIHAHIFRSLI